MSRLRLAAVDLGAESGRVMAADWDGERVVLSEAHRFPNATLRLPDGLHWNLPGLYQEILTGLRAAGQATPLAALGVDTWAVDFGLLDASGALLGLPCHYRDERTQGMVAEATAALGEGELFRRTGIQVLDINTLFQLMAMARRQPQVLAAARRLLMVPDLLHYWLTGVQSQEWTNATTTQFLTATGNAWDTELLGRLGIPAHFLAETVAPGTELGPLTAAAAAATGSGGLRVIAPATHDTASAVAVVAANRPELAYISSGTWSLVGVHAGQRLLSAAAASANVSNEGGLDGGFRLLKNVMGLWLVQQLQASLAAAGHRYSYAELTALAAQSDAAPALFDPDDPVFLRPGDLPTCLADLCARSGQAVPDGPGAMAHSILVSLACKYRWVLDRLEQLTGRRLTTVQVVGGGVRNDLLCQLTADISGRTVLAGPAEATALGNALVQLRTLGELGTSADFPAVVQASLALTEYSPHTSALELHGRWLALTGRV